MAGKKGKGQNGKGRGGLGEVLVPLASTVVLATAALHSLIDRQQHPNARQRARQRGHRIGAAPDRPQIKNATAGQHETEYGQQVRAAQNARKQRIQNRQSKRPTNRWGKRPGTVQKIIGHLIRPLNTRPIRVTDP